MRIPTLIAALIAAGALAGPVATPATASPAEPHHVSMVEAIDAELALRQAMDKLWTDHVIWTRDYIIAAVAGTPDQDAAAARLLANQEQIGAAIAGYYGDEAGDQLTALLKEHIMIAVDVVAAAKAGDEDALKAANARWSTNGNEIADFLADANPHWPKQILRDMMADHLATTTAEVVARLEGDWEGDVEAFDAVYEHILMMSDALSDGIIAQFPEKF